MPRTLRLATLAVALVLAVACTKKDDPVPGPPAVELPDQLGAETNAELQAKHKTAAIYDFQKDGVDHKVLVALEAPPDGYVIAFYRRQGGVLTQLRGIYHVSSPSVPTLEGEGGEPYVRSIMTGAAAIPQRLFVRGDSVELGVDQAELERKHGEGAEVREIQLAPIEGTK